MISRGRSIPGAVIGAWALVLALSTACAGRAAKPFDPIDPDLFASGSVYLYQPLNPVTIWVNGPEHLEPGETEADYTGPAFRQALLRDLDTETVRISLARVNAEVSAGLAVVGTSIKGESYVLVVDYIKYFASNHEVTVEYPSRAANAEPLRWTGSIPVYAGVGIRVRAEFVALETGLNISGLPALELAASRNAVSGRLTVQTLGITGPQVTGLMPIVSDISIASIHSALQSVAAIKAKLYEESTVVYPKIVGFEVPVTRLDAIPSITEALYERELTVEARSSPNPEFPGQRIVWIGWFPTQPAADVRLGRRAEADTREEDDGEEIADAADAPQEEDRAAIADATVRAAADVPE